MNIKLTMRELCSVVTRAKAAGLRPAEFGRVRILGDENAAPTVQRQGDDRPDTLFVAQLSRLGNNLNQIARKFHQLGLPAPSELAPVLQELRNVLTEVMRRDR